MLAKAKHTPGPWQINFNNVHQVCDSEENGRGCSPIAIMRGTNTEKRANAFLVAAAPDLLSALKYLLLQVDSKDRFEGHPWDAAINDAKQALAKATGEKA